MLAILIIGNCINSTMQSIKSLDSSKAESQCNSCQKNLSETRLYAAELEKRIKNLMDELAKWMKLYADSISDRAACSERHIKDLLKYAADYTAMVNKYAK